MIYNPGLLYRILDKYMENHMNEEEHGFIAALKWPDSYRLGKCSEKFWTELQEVYDICISESERCGCNSR